MSKEQQAKDIARLVTRLASNGDVESLSLMAKVCGHIETSDEPDKVAKASRIAFLGALPVAAIGMVTGNFRKLTEGMREVLAEAKLMNPSGGMTAGNCTADNWAGSYGGGGGCSKLNASIFTAYRGSYGRSEYRKPLFIGDGYQLLCIKCKDSEISNYRDFFTVEILATKDKTLSLDDILSDSSRFIEDGRGNSIPLILGENCRIDVVGNL